MRAAIYARVSTERQDREDTIASQLSALRAWAEQSGHELRPEHIYTDIAYSGSRLDRPGLDALRDAAGQAAFDVIGVVTPDRLARKYAYQVLLLEEFRRLGCMVVFQHHPLSDDPHDQLLLQIQGAVAEYERAVLSERFRRGKLHKARAGQWIGTTSPYGYRYIPKREGIPSKLVIDEEEAGLVRMLYGWLIDEQMTIRQILKRLDAGPWRPRNGRPCWSTSVVHHILDDPIYTGTAYTNRYRFVPAVKPRAPRRAGTPSCRQLKPQEEWIAIPVPSIIDEETRQQAQAQLARNAALSFRHNTKHDYLLRCLLTCETCGLAMFGIWRKGAKTKDRAGRRYYECRGKDRLLSARETICTHDPVRAEDLEEAVWQHVCQLLQDPIRLLAQFQQYVRVATEGDEHKQAMTQALDVRIGRVEREDHRLLDAYQAGVIDLEELTERRQVLKDRLQGLREQQDQQARLRQERARAEAVLTDLTAFCERIQARLGDASFEDKQAILQLLIERIIVGKETLEIRHVIPLNGPGLGGSETVRLRSDGVLETPLPAGSMQHGRNRSLQSAVGITGDQADTGESSGNQAAQEGQPEGTILTRAHIQPQHFPLPACVHPNGKDERHRNHPTIDPHFGEGGIQPDVRIGTLEPAAPELLNLLSQLGTEP
jgi:site-specific DNA recombinase